MSTKRRFEATRAGAPGAPACNLEETWKFSGRPLVGGSIGFKQYLNLEATMNALLIVLAVVAIVLLITGGVSSSLSFLLWIGGILLLIAVIVWLVNYLTGRRRTL
ncbi:MAG: hypothetical protein QOC59_1100 [Microbacteriaceae bacterium]|nr:hypothetical protein [Microbacteriaceae bacterium]